MARLVARHRHGSAHYADEETEAQHIGVTPRKTTWNAGSQLGRPGERSLGRTQRRRLRSGLAVYVVCDPERVT